MIFSAATQATPHSGHTSNDIPAQLRSEPTRPVTDIDRNATSADKNVQDKVTLSQAGLRRSRQEQVGISQENTTPQPPRQVNNNDSGSSIVLSPEEQQTVQKLKQRDMEVKAHEQAHRANAGQYAAGGPSYSYQTGPDGRRYAIGGEVPIDISKEKTPEQTIQKMRVVRRAAMAPANPSSADRNIAAAAGMKEGEAIRELNSEQKDSENTESLGNITETNATETNTTESPSESRPQRPVNRQDFQATYA